MLHLGHHPELPLHLVGLPPTKCFAFFRPPGLYSYLLCFLTTAIYLPVASATAGGHAATSIITLKLTAHQHITQVSLLRNSSLAVFCLTYFSVPPLFKVWKSSTFSPLPVLSQSTKPCECWGNIRYELLGVQSFVAIIPFHFGWEEPLINVNIIPSVTRVFSKTRSRSLNGHVETTHLSRPAEVGNLHLSWNNFHSFDTIFPLNFRTKIFFSTFLLQILFFFVLFPLQRTIFFELSQIHL